MNVLYLTYDGIYDPLGQSQITPYLKIIKGLCNKLYILSFEKKKNYTKRYSEEHFKILYNYNKNIFYKIYIFFIFFFKTFSICLKHNIKIIHARSHISCSIAIILKIFLDIRVVFDFRGLWFDERFEMGIWKSTRITNFFYRLLKKWENFLIYRSDQIIVLTNKMKEKINFKFNNKKKIEVIPCVTNHRFFNISKYPNKSKIYFKYKLDPRKKVLCYLGSLGGIYCIKKIFLILKKIRNYNKNLQIIIITNNVKELEIFFKKNLFYNFNNLKIINLEKKYIPEILSIIDYSLSYIKHGLGRQAQFPTRVGELISMGVPILSSNKIGDLDVIFSKYKFGKIFNLNKSFFSEIHQYFKLCDIIDKKKLRIKSKIFNDINLAEKKYSNIYETIK